MLDGILVQVLCLPLLCDMQDEKRFNGKLLF